MHFDAMAARRDTLLAQCTPEVAVRIEEDYRFVRMADLMSLVFCNAWPDPLEYGGHRVVLTGNVLTVTPDPFGGATVHLRIPARRVPSRRFASAADLGAEMATARNEMVEGTAVGVS